VVAVGVLSLEETTEMLQAIQEKEEMEFLQVSQAHLWLGQVAVVVEKLLPVAQSQVLAVLVAEGRVGSISPLQ
jgi:hypothetical protein